MARLQLFSCYVILFVCRQSSLPSAGSELSLPEGDLEWTGDHIEISGERVELRQKPSTYASAYYDNIENR
jgi:hypothetical protein